MLSERDKRDRSQWRRQGAGQRSRQRCADAAIQSEHAHGCLAAENRRGEGVHRHGPAEIGPRIEVRAQVRVEIDGDSADRDLARPRYVGSGRYAGMIVVVSPGYQPGCRGAAARLPKKPGIQKLTPPSSASDACETSASAAAKAPVEIRRVRCARLVRDVACDAVRVVVRSMSAPRPSG